VENNSHLSNSILFDDLYELYIWLVELRKHHQNQTSQGSKAMAIIFSLLSQSIPTKVPFANNCELHGMYFCTLIDRNMMLHTVDGATLPKNKVYSSVLLFYLF